MKAKGWVEALTSRSRAEVAEVEGSVISEVLWKGFQEIPAELWHFPPQEACSFYAVCVFFVSLLKNTYLKKVTKGNQGKKLLSGLQLRKRKCVCQRLGVAAEEKRAAPNGQANSKAKQVSSGWLFLGGEFPPTALFCFYSLENSVFFSFEAIMDLMLSAVWVNDETWLMCRP